MRQWFFFRGKLIGKFFVGFFIFLVGLLKKYIKNNKKSLEIYLVFIYRDSNSETKRDYCCVL
jgi:hypothetical protein